MHAGGDPNIEPLLQWLEPAQRHANAGIRLAGRNRLQQLLGDTTEIDQIDIEIVLGEDAPLLRDRRSRRADRARKPGGA